MSHNGKLAALVYVKVTSIDSHNKWLHNDGHETFDITISVIDFLDSTIVFEHWGNYSH